MKPGDEQGQKEGSSIRSAACRWTTQLTSGAPGWRPGPWGQSRSRRPARPANTTSSSPVSQLIEGPYKGARGTRCSRAHLEVARGGGAGHPHGALGTHNLHSSVTLWDMHKRLKMRTDSFQHYRCLCKATRAAHRAGPGAAAAGGLGHLQEGHEVAAISL
jgi:hypothetical protein